MLYNAFQLARSAPSRDGIYTPMSHVPRIHPSIPNCILIGSAVFAQLMAKNSYTLECALKHNEQAIKKLITAINAIKKLIV